MGDPMSPEEEEAHYLDMQQSDARKDYRSYFRPKFRVDAFWTTDYSCLKDIVRVCEPDMIVADFFVDAVRDIQYQMGIPIATVWPQMPYGMAGASYIPGMPGFQIDALTSEHASLWTRIRAELRPLRALPAVLSYLRFIRDMRQRAGVNYSLPILNKPNHLVLVNSFWGLETPKDLPPLLAAVGPILADEFPLLDDSLEVFFRSHSRVVYVSFGGHIQLQPYHLKRFMAAFSELLQEGVVDGIIWAANATQRELFARDQTILTGTGELLVDDILENRHKSWYFTPWAPQRAILNRAETVLFVTHGGGSSVNEALFHGTRMLSLGFFFDQPLNGLRIQEAGVGLALDKAGFSEKEILAKSRILLQDIDGTIEQDVQRMQHIAHVSARKKEYAVDLIEEVLYDHKFSLSLKGDGQRRRPMHLQTADARMSAWRAKNWDLTCVGILAFASFAGLFYIRLSDWRVLVGCNIDM
ncbi:Fc.00g038840.m01.CDS01 [Cosmosporella sp. VM-42]